MRTPKYPVYGLHDKMREIFTTNGMNVAKASRITGLAVNTLYAYTRADAEPCAKTLQVIGGKMGVSVDWLLGLSDKKELK